MEAWIPAQAATPQLALQAAERFAVGPGLVRAAIGHGWGGIIVIVHGSCRMELAVGYYMQLYVGADAGNDNLCDSVGLIVGSVKTVDG